MMAGQLTWHCTYCEGTNPYGNTHCQNCGAARHIDTEFKSIPVPEEEKPKQTPEEILDDIKDITGKVADIYDDVAPILAMLGGSSVRTSPRRRRKRRFFG
jgi:hypothetical protein